MDVLKHSDPERSDAVLLQSSSRYHNDQLHRLFQLQQEGKFCDVNIKSCGDDEIPVHANIIYTCSPFFKDKIDQFEENQCGNSCLEIKLRTIPHRILSHVIQFIYKGEISVPSIVLKDILSAAEEIHLDELVILCKQSIKPITTAFPFKDNFKHETLDKCLLLPKDKVTQANCKVLPVQPLQYMQNLSTHMSRSLPLLNKIESKNEFEENGVFMLNTSESKSDTTDLLSDARLADETTEELNGFEDFHLQSNIIAEKLDDGEGDLYVCDLNDMVVPLPKPKNESNTFSDPNNRTLPTDMSSQLSGTSNTLDSSEEVSFSQISKDTISCITITTGEVMPKGTVATNQIPNMTCAKISKRLNGTNHTIDTQPNVANRMTDTQPNGAHYTTDVETQLPSNHSAVDASNSEEKPTVAGGTYSDIFETTREHVDLLIKENMYLRDTLQRLDRKSMNHVDLFKNHSQRICVCERKISYLKQAYGANDQKLEEISQHTNTLTDRFDQDCRRLDGVAYETSASKVEFHDIFRSHENKINRLEAKIQNLRVGHNNEMHEPCQAALENMRHRYETDHKHQLELTREMIRLLLEINAELKRR